MRPEEDYSILASQKHWQLMIKYFFAEKILVGIEKLLKVMINNLETRETHQVVLEALPYFERR